MSVFVYQKNILNYSSFLSLEFSGKLTILKFLKYPSLSMQTARYLHAVVGRKYSSQLSRFRAKALHTGALNNVLEEFVYCKPRLMLTFVNTLLCLVILHYTYSSNWNAQWLENRNKHGFEVLSFYARKFCILLTEPLTSMTERIILK